MFDVNKIREDFPILERTVNGQPLIYFDNAATSQTPNQVIDVISDYSYLFKRLKRMKLIHNCTEKEFMLLVFKKMNLINKKAYDQFKVDGRLKSLKNSTSEQRMNNFHNIFLD